MNASAEVVTPPATSDIFTAPNGVTLQRSKLYVDGMGNAIAKLYTIDEQAPADATDHLMAYYLDHNLIAAVNVPGADGRFTADEVKAFSTSLTHAGLSGWDNPEIAQAVVLNDYTKEDPCVDTSVHPGVDSSGFWTKRQTKWTLDEAGSSRSFWYVLTNGGLVNHYYAYDRFRARPVRVAAPAGQ